MCHNSSSVPWQILVFTPTLEICLLAEFSPNSVLEPSLFSAPIMIFLDRRSS